MLKGGPAGLVFANQVVPLTDADDSGAVSLDVLTRVCLEQYFRLVFYLQIWIRPYILKLTAVHVAPGTICSREGLAPGQGEEARGFLWD